MKRFYLFKLNLINKVILNTIKHLVVKYEALYKGNMKLVRKISPIFDRVIGILAALAAAVLLFIVLIISMEVALRYFWNLPIVWVVEITEYGLLFVTFLVAAWVLKREGHVKMDLVLNRLKPRIQALFNIITSIIGAIICLVIIWYSAQTTWIHFQEGSFLPSFLNIPDAYILFIIPIGYFLLFIQFLRRTYGYLGQWRAS